jgi:HEAT repeat protein
MELIGQAAATLPADHPERPRLGAWLHEGLADSDGLVRRSGATALGSILPPRPDSIDRLRRAVNDPEDYVRTAAGQSLRRLEEPAP